MTTAGVTEREIKEMLLGLEGVTPGPWTSAWLPSEPMGVVSSNAIGLLADCERPIRYGDVPADPKTNAAHIARCSPERMRSILTLALSAIRTPPAGEVDAITELLFNRLGLTRFGLRLEDVKEVAREIALASPAPVSVEVKPASIVDDGVAALFLDAWAEAEKAMRKFPQPNYVISKVAEEAGEVVKAAIHCAEGRDTPQHVAEEIRQAMAMLIRLYIEGDQVHGLAPVLSSLSHGEPK